MVIPSYWYLDPKWPRAGNWGDIVAPEIIRHVSGREPEWRPLGGGRLLTVGSIAGKIQENDVVWGSGLIKPMMFSVPAGIEWRAVRGPLTRAILLAHGCAVPAVYGDPAALMPAIHPTAGIAQEHDIGVIPHYVDREHFERVDDEVRGRVHVIDVMGGVRHVMEAVARCRIVLSSALHGVILAEALGRPAAPISMGPRVIGGSFKFDDYYLGSGRMPVALRDWSERVSGAALEDAVNAALNVPPPRYDLDRLVASFPYEFAT